MVLKQLAVRLMSALRDYDIACRYGGEEFLVVAPETDVEQALKLAERLRMTIATMNYSTDTEDISVTVSVGVSMLQPPDTIETAISRADVALYEAKENGRNRVCLSDEKAGC